MLNTHVLAMKPSSKLAGLLILSVLLWATGLPTNIKKANAYALTFVSDTLTDSDLGVASGHTIAFTIEDGLDENDTIFVDFDPTGNNFQITDLDVADFVSESNITVVAACGGGASEATLATTTESFTLTICSGDTIASSTALTLPIASSTSVITNPASQASYIIHIETTNNGTSLRDQADTFVAILNDVHVSAAVASTFTFTVTGVASGTLLPGGETTSTTTTSTAIDFGTLPTAANSSTTAAQLLSVTTNAVQGFTVTVKADRNLTSSTGADINTFANESGQATPITWSYPSGTLGQDNTYGHFGLSSTDDINTDEFANGTLFVGNFATTTRAVFHHNGASNGAADDIGDAYVIYKIAVTTLQEAAPDYTNTLTYVATPVF